MIKLKYLQKIPIFPIILKRDYSVLKFSKPNGFAGLLHFSKLVEVSWRQLLLLTLKNEPSLENAFSFFQTEKYHRRLQYDRFRKSHLLLKKQLCCKPNSHHCRATGFLNRNFQWSQLAN